jgi:hypothetical protein
VNKYKSNEIERVKDKLERIDTEITGLQDERKDVFKYFLTLIHEKNNIS